MARVSADDVRRARSKASSMRVAPPGRPDSGSATQPTRAQREADFHDTRFGGSEPARPASRFYRLTAPSRGRFEELIGSIRPGSRVLELGCGPGSAAWDLAATGHDVLGIDISETAIRATRIEAAKRGLDPANFSVMNAEHPEFGDSEFDA